MGFIPFANEVYKLRDNVKYHGKIISASTLADDNGITQLRIDIQLKSFRPDPPVFVTFLRLPLPTRSFVGRAFQEIEPSEGEKLHTDDLIGFEIVFTTEKTKPCNINTFRIVWPEEDDDTDEEDEDNE